MTWEIAWVISRSRTVGENGGRERWARTVGENGGDAEHPGSAAGLGYLHLTHR